MAQWIDKVRSSGWRAGVVAGLVLSCGCAGPQAKIVRSGCVFGPSETQTDSLNFMADIQTTQLLNEQLMLHVGLQNARGEPVRSVNNKYRDSAGRVAGTRTMMVLRSPWMFEKQSVSIPVSQLDVGPDDFPISAVMSVFNGEGQVLARQRSVVPFAPTYAANVTPSEASNVESGQGRSEAPPQVDSKPPTSAEAPVAVNESTPAAAAADARSEPADTRQPSAPPPVEPVAELPREPEPRPRNEPRPEAPKPIAAPQAAPPPATRPSQPQGARAYVVQRGDTLTGIAKRELGSALRWPEVFELNRDQMDSPDQLRVGMELQLPP